MRTHRTPEIAILNELRHRRAFANIAPSSTDSEELLSACATMKDKIHPDYHPVVFFDRAADFKFLTRSTLTSKEKIKWEDGKEYPLVVVDISAASHPFYTGKMKYIDSAGRVEKFQKKYKWGAEKK